MEGVSASVYKKMRGYWRSRGYQRINGEGSRRRRMNKVELGGSSRKRRRRFWGIKIKPKLKFIKSITSPKKLLLWLRDGYVKMMLSLANSRVMGPSGYGGAIGPQTSFGQRPLKEYDEKMIIEIYKSLVIAQGQLVPRDAARFGSNPPTVLSAILE